MEGGWLLAVLNKGPLEAVSFWISMSGGNMMKRPEPLCPVVGLTEAVGGHCLRQDSGADGSLVWSAGLCMFPGMLFFSLLESWCREDSGKRASTCSKTAQTLLLPISLICSWEVGLGVFTWRLPKNLTQLHLARLCRLPPAGQIFH